MSIGRTLHKKGGRDRETRGNEELQTSTWQLELILASLMQEVSSGLKMSHLR